MRFPAIATFWVFFLGACDPNGPLETPAHGAQSEPTSVSDPLLERSRQLESSVRTLTPDEVEELLGVYYSLARNGEVVGTPRETEVLEKGIRLARSSVSRLARKVECVFLFRCGLYPFAHDLASQLAGDAKADEILALLEAWGQDDFERLPKSDVILSDSLTLAAYRSRKPSVKGGLLTHRIYFVEEKDRQPSLAFYTLSVQEVEGDLRGYLMSHSVNEGSILVVYDGPNPALEHLRSSIQNHAHRALKGE